MNSTVYQLDGTVKLKNIKGRSRWTNGKKNLQVAADGNGNAGADDAAGICDRGFR